MSGRLPAAPGWASKQAIERRHAVPMDRSRSGPGEFALRDTARRFRVPRDRLRANTLRAAASSRTAPRLAPPARMWRPPLPEASCIEPYEVRPLKHRARWGLSLSVGSDLD